MTFCSFCGVNLEENQRFCPNCGPKIDKLERDPATQATNQQKEDTTLSEQTSQKGLSSHFQNNDNTALVIRYSVTPRQSILDKVNVDREDFDEVTKKAKKGLDAAWRFTRKGFRKGAELASQGLEAAKETIDDQRFQVDSEPSKKFNQVKN
jgi:hypothetical protein